MSPSLPEMEGIRDGQGEEQSGRRGVVVDEGVVEGCVGRGW